MFEPFFEVSAPFRAPQKRLTEVWALKKSIDMLSPFSKGSIRAESTNRWRGHLFETN
jgi:hypothetical protein